MGTTSDKLTYLNTTKGKIKDVINMTGANITSETTFRNYAKALYDGYINVLKDKGTLLDNMPKETSTGYITNAADLPVYESKMSKLSTQKNTILPDGYTQVDYIKNTGTQYIDTGLFPLEISSGVFDISWDEKASNSGSYFMGGYYNVTSGTPYYSPLIINRQNYVGIGYAEWTYSDYKWNLGDRHKIVFTLIAKKQLLSVDGVEIINTEATLTRPETTATVPILVYQYQKSRLSGYGWNGKIYSIKLYGNNNELIRNYIPCYRNSDNEVGLYDVVNNAFYTNQGTGSFTYGSVALIPNPDYPQEVKTVKGYSNLFDKTTATYENTILNDNGVASSSNSNKHLTTYISVKPNTQYTIQGTIASNAMGFRIYYYDKSKGWISRTSNLLSDVVPYTFTTPVNCYYIQFQVPINIYDESTVIINEGNVAIPNGSTNWVYTTITDGTNTKDIAIPLNNNEICGISNYKDELIVDKNGHCWLNKKIGKQVLVGSNDEDWTSVNVTSSRSAWRINIDNIEQYTSQSAIPNLLSNYFIKASQTATWKEGTISRMVLTDENIVVCLNGEINTVSKLKAWLSTHNTDVYYVLATPQLIDLNYNVDLSLFKGVNNISNSEDMDMEIKYILENYKEGE